MGQLLEVLRQTVGDHRLDMVLLRLGDVGTLAQLALVAVSFGGENVAQIRALTLDAAARRQLEALLGRALGFHLQLGHRRRAVYTARAGTQEFREAATEEIGPPDGRPTWPGRWSRKGSRCPSAPSGGKPPAMGPGAPAGAPAG